MNKQDKDLLEKCNIVDRYTVSGVPTRSLEAMCQELNINYDNLNTFLGGQTGALVGGECLFYGDDIKRFIRGLPNND